ncbi:MAG: LLM class flavin-dependent oxidoreductase [Thaumarchaeota archaeon]|nr:LLM class flavin-dependent oxidoreductase [Nitrososphaerota archaeon]
MAARRILFSRELTSTDVHENLRDGILAEEQGYDCLWIPDHLTDVPPPTVVLDAWTTLSYVGSHTKRIRVASGVTDTQRIHPAKTANIVATLDNITDGRAVLGIGAGEVMNTRPYGIPWESSGVRIKRVEEAIRVIRLLWSSSYRNPVSFEGDYYRLDQAHLDLPPVQKPSPPIYVGAYSSSKMLAIAGELADGWYPAFYYTVGGYREKLTVIRDAAARAGRSFDSIDRMAYVPIVLGEKSPSLMRDLKKYLKRQMIMNRYLFKILGVEDALESVPKELNYQLIAPTLGHSEMIDSVVDKLLIPDEALEKGLDEMMVIGTPDQCIQSLERFVKAGATHICVSLPLGGREDYRSIASEIIPHFKKP